VDHLGWARRDMRQTWILAIALIALLFVAGMPVVEAAVQRVRISDSAGGRVDAKNIGDLGLFGAPGSNGAVAVRSFAGGSGLLGTGQCGQGPRPNSTTIAANANTIITGLLLSGPGNTLSISAPALEPTIGPGPVITFSTNVNSPNMFVGLGNGLTVTP
jgi:hypothetical protein